MTLSDRLAHHPRLGCPRMTDAQLTELLRRDAERLDRVTVVQRAGKSAGKKLRMW